MRTKAHTLNMSNESQSHSAPPAQKRRKIALACERCRDRKIRCDGEKPACGACRRRSNRYQPDPCLYINDNQRIVADQDYIDSLHSRIRQLERTQARQEPLVTEDTPHFGAGTNARQGDGKCEHYAPQPLLSSDEGICATGRAQLEEAGDGVFPAAIGQQNQTADNILPSSFRDSQKPMAVNYLPSAVPSVAMQSPERHSQIQDGRGNLEETASLSRQKCLAATSGQYHDQESPVSAMGAAATPAKSTAQDGFYGTSSAITFLNQVQELLGPTTCSREGAASLPRPDPLARFFDRNSKVGLTDLDLPPRALTDHLLGHYWERTHYLFPIIHEDTFLFMYNQLWEAKKDTTRETTTLNVGIGSTSCSVPVFYCALNSMLALGCNFSSLPPAQRIILSDNFSQRSLDLLLANILGDGSLALVQALLIVAQYLQSTNLPSRCWNVVGLALRVAQGLGLYVDESNKNASPLETEIRRRTWHGCLMLDTYEISLGVDSVLITFACRITGMTLGRPMVASGLSDVPLPAAVDDQYVESGLCEQPDNSISRNMFYVQTLKLYNVMGEILTQVYKPWEDAKQNAQSGFERPRNSPINVVIDLEYALSDFESNLPPQLHWDRSGMENGEPTYLERQRNVLHTRFVKSRNMIYLSQLTLTSFLHLKILLHRPVLHQLYTKSRDTTLFSSMSQSKRQSSSDSVVLLLAQRCAQTCVESAQALITLIETMSQSDSASGGAWWYEIFCKFMRLGASKRMPSNAAR